MKGRKGFTLIELLVVIAIIAVLAAILFPVFARARKAAQNSTCQSNMSQIGRALKMYLSEWHDTYPTNRIYSGTGMGSFLASVQLTPADTLDAQGQPKRFQYGVNWVEALYPYVEQISKDSSGAWLCPAASNKCEKPGGPQALTSAVSYTFNYNLLEQPEGIIKTAANLMVSREIDRKVNSVLRPATLSMDASSRPDSAFLTTNDNYVTPSTTNPYQHNQGSNIMFADSHVKNYATDFMPKDCQWDVTDSCWYNNADANNQKLYKTIQVSP